MARLEQVGIRQERYLGRVKTKRQLYPAATVTNLTMLAKQIRVFGDVGPDGHRSISNSTVGDDHGADRHPLPTWVLAWLRTPAVALSSFPTRAFRPAFFGRGSRQSAAKANRSMRPGPERHSPPEP